MNNQENKVPYFTKEIMDKISNMSIDEMNEVLLEFESTNFWIALLKYMQARMQLVQNGLQSLDPYKDPTNMARTQGTLMGFSDIQEMVITLKQKQDTIEAE